MGLDYKLKYQELKANFLAATDRSYSMGYEHGQRDASLQQMQQQQEEQMQMAQMQAQMGQDQGAEAAPQEDPGFADQVDSQSLDQGETELESALNELESILSGDDVDKSEAAKIASQVLKSLSNVREIKSRMELRKSLVLQPLTKSERMKVPAMRPSVQAQKKAITLQKKLVNSVVEKMRQEETNSIDKILSSLKKQGVAK